MKQEPAFPTTYNNDYFGMTLRDWFAGQALSNPEICTGHAQKYQLVEWFGARLAIPRSEIRSRQAYEHADAMLAARTEGE